MRSSARSAARLSPALRQPDAFSGVLRDQQAARILEAEIRAGTFPEGKPIPSRITLTQRFGIAQATAGRVHAQFAERGYVVAVPGVGMVVTPRARWAQ